jgi:hypothetical protein
MTRDARSDPMDDYEAWVEGLTMAWQKALRPMLNEITRLKDALAKAEQERDAAIAANLYLEAGASERELRWRVFINGWLKAFKTREEALHALLEAGKQAQNP